MDIESQFIDVINTSIAIRFRDKPSTDVLICNKDIDDEFYKFPGCGVSPSVSTFYVYSAKNQRL